MKLRFIINIEINNGELHYTKKISRICTVMNRALNFLLGRVQPRTESEDVQVIPIDRIISRFLSTLPRGFGGGRCPLYGLLLAQTCLP